MSSSRTDVSRSSLVKTILITGLIAGTLDIMAACVNVYISSGTDAVTVLQYIASVFLGKESYAMGFVSALLGLIVHYAISYGWTILLFLLYPKLKFLSGNKVLVGLLYGVFVWLVMNLVILKLIGLGKGSFNLLQATIGCGILMLCIGLPIVWGANTYYQRRKNVFD
ncbi:DUF1440 domain-containing protein [Fulvivirgaceae bacterium PWU5]|uniref:DUF1440 domain-containing protein n=1 Tax=Dawidia cretensis TaxID=2782350 RepID=A0AAP2E3X6_9BACT|nr:DUF1440 domain-containing protein [Dawidia cretensis]MBT1711684.1 DUF1440 domain-containing protein [Dawidia cretensis]